MVSLHQDYLPSAWRDYAPTWVDYGILLGSFGLFFTPWLLDPALVLAGGVTLAAIAVLWAGFRSGRMSRGWLAAMAGLYGVFALGVVVLRLS